MNLDLFKLRSENVNKVLVSQFEIDAIRIKTDGICNSQISEKIICF